jgi:hypothetical protein
VIVVTVAGGPTGTAVVSDDLDAALTAAGNDRPATQPEGASRNEAGELP